MLRIAICEENLLHQKYLQNELEKLLDEAHEFYCFSSSSDFRCSLLKKHIFYDLVFTDIKLGNMSGIELSQEINRESPLTQIIYVTSYIEYFSEAYRTEHVWFINKKEISKYLPKALNKALKAIQFTKSLHLNFSWQKEHFSVLQTEIIYIERNLRTSEIHTSERIYRTSEKLEELKEQLTDSFVFSHRSYIINMNRITSLNRNIVVLDNTLEIPVSRSKWTELKNAYSLFLSK